MSEQYKFINAARKAGKGSGSKAKGRGKLESPKKGDTINGTTLPF